MFFRWCRCTWRYKQGPSHALLFDIDPLDPWSHVPSLCEHRGQRSLLPEALSYMSTEDRDVDQHGAAHVHLSQPDRWRKGQSSFTACEPHLMRKCHQGFFHFCALWPSTVVYWLTSTWEWKTYQANSPQATRWMFNLFYIEIWISKGHFVIIDIINSVYTLNKV